jgi:hypothetical protein
MLVGREAEVFDDAPFNRMEGWGPDCHKWMGACMARPGVVPVSPRLSCVQAGGKRLLS